MDKILFIGVGGAGSLVADKVAKDYPELFDSVAIDTGMISGVKISCSYLNLMEKHGRNENPGFTMNKQNVFDLIDKNEDEIRELFQYYLQNGHIIEEIE